MNQKFVMPELKIGDKVMWHTDCDKNLAPTMAFVMECSACNCTLRLVSRTDMTQIKYDVRHIDDPVVENNPNIRENGAWSHHIDTLRLQELEEKLATLTREVNLMQDVLTSKAK